MCSPTLEEILATLLPIKHPCGVLFIYVLTYIKKWVADLKRRAENMKRDKSLYEEKEV